MIRPTVCRCGHDGHGPHLCHRCCAAAGVRRYYAPNLITALAGMQMKSGVRETVACDACWTEFAAEIRARWDAAKEPWQV